MPVPGFPPPWPLRATQNLGRLTFSLLLRRWCGWRVQGAEQLAGLEQVVLAPTHASHLDFWAVLEGLPPTLRRRTYVAAAEDYFYAQPWRRWVTSLFSYHNFPLNRRQATVGEYRRLRQLLAEGFSLLMFAQGSRTRDGSLLPFRPLLAMLAADSGVPLVPVAVRGTFEALPVGRWWPRRSPIEVRFGAPLAPRLAEGELLPKAGRRLNQELEAHVRKLYAGPSLGGGQHAIP
jgi:1-acyl-sn-glycerol-3-phosphate acyltransferase